MPGEFSYISWIRSQLATDPRVLIGPGDDCAALRPLPDPILVTTDVLTEGVDFLLAETSAEAIGEKAMAVNLSDIAAMAGEAVAAVVGVVFPRGASPDLPHNLFKGLRRVAEQYHCAIVGGDTNSWEGGLVISVTVLGQASDPVRRSGAKPGDWLFVTGPLGGSILGRHLRPTPRLTEARQLKQAVPLHAMIDISDGLSADLQHILEESHCGAILRASAIPIHPDVDRLALQTGRTALDHALSDGEDFELLFAVSPEDGERLLKEPPCPGLTHIGECVESGLWLDTAAGRVPLTPRGWVHDLG